MLKIKVCFVALSFHYFLFPFSYNIKLNIEPYSLNSLDFKEDDFTSDVDNSEDLELDRESSLNEDQISKDVSKDNGKSTSHYTNLRGADKRLQESVQLESISGDKQGLKSGSGIVTKAGGNGGRKHWTWTHFTINLGDSISSKVHCKHCSALVSARLERLRIHLEKEHPGKIGAYLSRFASNILICLINFYTLNP